MVYLYGISDTKYRRRTHKWNEKRQGLRKEYKYRTNSVLAKHVGFDHHAHPIQFRVQATSLVELAAIAVDKLPLPSVFKWTYADVKRWIRRYGYPQYMNTFEVNKIWGRKLLLVDAAALSAMNIKDFEHIKHIAYGIRMLFHLELTKFSSKVSLPDERPNELYLLWHTQTGINYDDVRRSDLYRRMQIIRERLPDLEHWDLLTLWLAREQQRKFKELQPSRLVPATKPPAVEWARELHSIDDEMCVECMPPCDCCWNANDVRLPWILSVLPHSVNSSQLRGLASENSCVKCIPPCECRWLSRYYLTGTVMSCLQRTFPEKFSPIFDVAHKTVVSDSIIDRWIRFSI
ncbi:PREDICTED: uncharacterized protein LOC108610525 isoform X1 [Drosophila arizonae]|uniref:Uncharacterized protein LOC108610525 isoform X1 n=2 Tax=Drosophila arizonae TaxID=7263 RepID=A0ABM1NT80_DROAR|nr:PREDICTED: uncharacterized protein LOC108610525 isoform X1 [Drosophila arizonae]